MPNLHKIWELRSDKKVWSSTFWPYANHCGLPEGNEEENLWADKGCLDKFDSVLKKRRLNMGAKAYEKVPALNWLKSEDLPSGYYIAKPTIREGNAELTTGVDFTGNGKLKRGIKRDFLEAFDSFGSNGKKNGSMDVGWWGNCDKVALAGMLFQEPKKDVRVNGVTFSVNDIKGLLVVTADTQAGREEFVGERYEGYPDRVLLKDGTELTGTIVNRTLEDFRTGHFERIDGDFVVKRDVKKQVIIKDGEGDIHRIKAKEVESITREDKRCLSASLFHKTVKAWLRENKPFAMDHDPGPEVWNDNFDGAHIEKTYDVPSYIKVKQLNGYAGMYTGGEIAFYSTKLLKGEKHEKKYGYWIEKKAGLDVNSGWILGHGNDENPDFLWRVLSKKKSGFVNRKNKRNPFVLPKLVEEIYKKSIS